MNLVVGASGMLGSEICRNLTQAGKPVRALVRTSTDPAKQSKLKGVGAGLKAHDDDLLSRASLSGGQLFEFREWRIPQAARPTASGSQSLQQGVSHNKA